MKVFTLKRLTFLILSLNLIVVSPVLAQYFTITKFHSDITVQEDASFIVRETIEVKFQRPRHGIYREIPFQYRDEFGKRVTTPTTVLSVTDGTGKAWKYQVRKSGAFLNIRIGDPERFVEKIQTYVITYRVENAILFLDDHDELYWNVTGNDWKAEINEATAEVSLKTKERSKTLWAAGFVGRHGSREEAGYEAHGEAVKFFTKRNLRVGEGLTVAFGWDKGLVSPPSAWKRVLWAIDLTRNWIFFLPLFSLLFIVYRWHQKGRDPQVRESIAVMYQPPRFEDRPLTPAEVGALVDERLDPRDITSTIIGLAVKGYIKIDETKKEGLLFDSQDYLLQRLKGPDADLTPFETELMEDLFPGKKSGILVSGLKNKFYKNLNRLRETLYGELVRKKYFLSDPDKVRKSYALTGILLMVFASFAFGFLLPDEIGKSIFAGALTGLPLLIFSNFMPAKTRTGAAARMDILGFREFMDRAEKDRLERMGDENLFSTFLPYAIALNVEESWGKAFEGIYQAPPQWYGAPRGAGVFRPSLFTHSMNSMTSSLSSAMFSAPRGSSGGRGGGLGGGGSSGGGFGGGGGGSW